MCHKKKKEGYVLAMVLKKEISQLWLNVLLNL